MVRAQVSGKSSSLRELGEGSWWGALQSRYVTPLLSVLPTFWGELNPTQPVECLDVAAASGVDRGRGHPAALRLRSGPLWRLCI